MYKKRFIFYEYDDGTETIEDTEKNEYYHFCNELVGLLNEQQATINKLKEENKQLKREFKESINDLIRKLDDAEKEKFKKMYGE